MEVGGAQCGRRNSMVKGCRLSAPHPRLRVVQCAAVAGKRWCSAPRRRLSSLWRGTAAVLHCFPHPPRSREYTELSVGPKSRPRRRPSSMVSFPWQCASVLSSSFASVKRIPRMSPACNTSSSSRSRRSLLGKKISTSRTRLGDPNPEKAQFLPNYQHSSPERVQGCTM